MKKSTILMVLLGCILSLCNFTGCEPQDSTDTDAASSTDSTSVSEKDRNETPTVQNETITSDENEIVEEVQEFVVDENADGEENGCSKEIVIP